MERNVGKNYPLNGRCYEESDPNRHIIHDLKSRHPGARFAASRLSVGLSGLLGRPATEFIAQSIAKSKIEDRESCARRRNSFARLQCFAFAPPLDWRNRLRAAFRPLKTTPTAA